MLAGLAKLLVKAAVSGMLVKKEPRLVLASFNELKAAARRTVAINGELVGE